MASNNNGEDGGKGKGKQPIDLTGEGENNGGKSD
jgi:hypothetical protein